jgi:hypothetical membrane protein
VFVGGWALGGDLEPHCSAVRQYISELGRPGAAHPWIFATFVGSWGMGLIALAVAVAPALRTRPWPLAMPLCFALAGAHEASMQPHALAEHAAVSIDSG